MPGVIGPETWKEWNVLSSSIRQGYVTTGELDDIITTLNGGEYNPAQLAEVLEQLPEMVEVKNLNYDTTEVMYKSKTLYNGANPMSGVPDPNYNISSQINSNVGQGVASSAKTVQTNRVLTMTKDATTGKASISDELFKWRGGSPTPTRAKMVAANIASAVVATGVGISLGKTIDSALYNLNPDFWDSNGMSTINPETWNRITVDGEYGLGEAIFNAVFDLDPNSGNPTMYIEQETFAYLTSYMMNMGVFDGILEAPDFDPKYETYEPHYDYGAMPFLSSYYRKDEFNPAYNQMLKIESIWNVSDGLIMPVQNLDGSNSGFIAVTTNPSQTLTRTATTYFDNSQSTTDTETYNIDSIIYINEEPIYYTYFNTRNDLPGLTVSYSHVPCVSSATSLYTSMDSIAEDVANYLYNNNDVVDSRIDGITDQATATQFDTTGVNPLDLAAVLLALQTQFPELWDNRVEFSPDGETTKVYVPVAFPTGGTSSQPTTEGGTQAQPSPQIDIKGDNVSEELIKSLIDMLTKNSPALNTDSSTPASIGGASPNDFNTGTGSSPVVVTPVGSASALWKIYNPSQSELNTFGAWLWSSNFVDQLLKVFNDPMQAIIGLHKIFCTPSVSGSGPIKVGYLTSDATANYVDDQYVDVDCGSIDLYEFYGNVFDYEPFTRLQLFLPFIGFVDLSTSDCMRGKIKVKYRVDVLTGQCLAAVSVVRDMHENILYTYTGNCAVQYPVSSGSYVGIIGGLLGIAGTIASGGSIAPMAIGAIKGIGGIHTDVKHSGSIQGSSGAMGCKKPYLVIERPQTAMPNNGELLEGLPENETVKISQLTGYVKVKKAEFDISCTNEELEMIKEMMLEGFHI